MNKSHRKLAREKAVFAIYQWLLTNASKEELHLYLITFSKQCQNVFVHNEQFRTIE